MAKIKKLPNRKKKASKGVAIRVSDEVHSELGKRRGQQSWDAHLRRLLGLPDRQGNRQILIEGMLEQISGTFILKTPKKSWNSIEQVAYEIAFLAAAKKKMKTVPKPIRMRELV